MRYNIENNSKFQQSSKTSYYKEYFLNKCRLTILAYFNILNSDQFVVRLLIKISYSSFYPEMKALFINSASLFQSHMIV